MCEVHKASIGKLCSGHYTAEQIAAWADPRHPDEYEQAIRSMATFVAEHSGRIVGLAIADWNQGLILAVYVHPDHAGVGVGRKLVHKLEAEAGSAGVTQLWLHATLNSVSFYERCGFVSLGAATNTLPNGCELRCVRMQKRLMPQPAGSPSDEQ
jgi:N-acetylglutamate synthase-like GNAT family acetyltransferase